MNPQQLIDQIIQQKLGNTTDPQAEVLRQQLEQGFMQIMVERLLKQLDDQQVEQLSQLMDTTPEPPQIQQFIQDNVQDLAAFMQQAAQDFEKLYASKESQ